SPLERDLDLLLVQLPVAHARQEPEESPFPLRDDLAPTVDERPLVRGPEPLLLLERVLPAQREHFLVRRPARKNPGEGLARERRALPRGAGLGGGAEAQPGGHAPPERAGESLD